MSQPRENLQRARQLGQDDHPTDSSHSTRITTSPSREDLIFLCRAFDAALSHWEKLLLGGPLLLWVLAIVKDKREAHCTSEWILNTTAPYHTTNQLCAFAENPITNFSSPATYKGVETHGHGIVKLDLKSYAHKAKNDGFVSTGLLPRYAPLELHFTQYVPKKANTISVSQLMRDNHGVLIPHRVVLAVVKGTTLAMIIGNETIAVARSIEGHYVLKAKVPSRGCKCPDSKERSIFKSQTKGPASDEFIRDQGIFERELHNCDGGFSCVRALYASH